MYSEHLMFCGFLLLNLISLFSEKLPTWTAVHGKCDGCNLCLLPCFASACFIPPKSFDQGNNKRQLKVAFSFKKLIMWAVECSTRNGTGCGSVAGRFPLRTCSVIVNPLYPKPALKRYRIFPAGLGLLLVFVQLLTWHHLFALVFLDVSQISFLKALNLTSHSQDHLEPVAPAKLWSSRNFI